MHYYLVCFQVKNNDFSLIKRVPKWPTLPKRMMFFYGSLIILLFVLLLVGAGLVLRRSEKEHEDEIRRLKKENDYLRDKVNRLTAHEMLKI